jgi:hypothetical protein
MLKRLWAGQKARGHVPPDSDQVEIQRQRARDEMEQEIVEAMQLQQESRAARRADQEPGK